MSEALHDLEQRLKIARERLQKCPSGKPAKPAEAGLDAGQVGVELSSSRGRLKVAAQ